MVLGIEPRFFKLVDDDVHTDEDHVRQIFDINSDSEEANNPSLNMVNVLELSGWMMSE